MQTLVFNTTSKTVTLYSEEPGSKIIHTFSEVPTVKVMESYYEVMRKVIDEKGTEIRVPVARFPIANSNMLIQN
jgi:hypothetical protein